MSIDEDFARDLRDHIDAAGLTVDVNTSRVIAGARRRRLVRGSAAACVLTATLAIGIAASVQYWPQGATTIQPANPSASQPASPSRADNTGWPTAAYWHTAFTYDLAGVTHHGETWLPHTGDSGVMVTDGDRSTAERVSATYGDFLDPASCKSTTITWDELYQLPTDPQGLTGVLTACRSGDAGFLGSRLLMLQRSPASPALQRAIWTALSALPSSTTTPDVTDSQGRPGTQLQWNAGTANEDSFIFDPSDGRLLDATMRPESTHVVYLDQGPADALPPGLTIPGWP